MKSDKNICNKALLQYEQDFTIASAIASVDGVPPSEDDKKLFMLYKRGTIDLETAKCELKKKYSK